MRPGTTAPWNIVSYLVYTALVCAGGLEAFYSLFFAMATDGCHDSACDASYHVWPAMLIVWIGVGAVLVTTLAMMVRSASRGKVVLGWPFAGLLGLGLVLAIALSVLH